MPTTLARCAAYSGAIWPGVVVAVGEQDHGLALGRGCGAGAPRATPTASPMAVALPSMSFELHLGDERVEQVIVEGRRRQHVRLLAEHHHADAIRLAARDEVANHRLGRVESRRADAPVALGHVLASGSRGRLSITACIEPERSSTSTMSMPFSSAGLGPQRVDRPRHGQHQQAQRHGRGRRRARRGATRESPSGRWPRGDSVPSLRRGVRRSSPKVPRQNTSGTSTRAEQEPASSARWRSTSSGPRAISGYAKPSAQRCKRGRPRGDPQPLPEALRCRSWPPASGGRRRLLRPAVRPASVGGGGTGGPSSALGMEPTVEGDGAAHDGPRRARARRCTPLRVGVSRANLTRSA